MLAMPHVLICEMGVKVTTSMDRSTPRHTIPETEQQPSLSSSRCLEKCHQDRPGLKAHWSHSVPNHQGVMDRSTDHASQLPIYQ